MLKMFSTQLAGLMGRIHTKQEEEFEDAARLLAQAIAGEGRIFIFGAKEMAAVGLEAVTGEEPLKAAHLWDGLKTEFIAADRALIVSRFSNDSEAVAAAKILQSEGVPFVTISTSSDGDDDESAAILADVHIDLFLKKGLLPDETGGRYGYPAPMAALFAYYGLKFTIDEILADYDDM